LKGRGIASAYPLVSKPAFFFEPQRRENPFSTSDESLPGRGVQKPINSGLDRNLRVRGVGEALVSRTTTKDENEKELAKRLASLFYMTYIV